MSKVFSFAFAAVTMFFLLTATSGRCFAQDVVWSDDNVPAGALQLSDGFNTWNWAATNPAPVSGALAHPSSLQPGLHEQYFNYTRAPLSVGAGEVLFAYVFLDVANPPSEVMLSWNAGGWEHRAYWGGNSINYGTDGTTSRQFAGPLPATGRWVRLEVPASRVGLEGATITGMGFSLFNGTATWDKAGKAPRAGTPTTAAAGASEVVWSDDTVPDGAVQQTDGRDAWNWTASSPAPASGAHAHQSSLLPGLHEHFFNHASKPLRSAPAKFSSPTSISTPPIHPAN
ncbi:MAG: hypothetical protein HY736_06145 [Verrucomicrobia bacterium]|nr:hypothetical protein [Verrucomicrobiota bacterium]